MERLMVSPKEAAEMAGLGRSTIYKLIARGEVKSAKVGARRLVSVEGLREWAAREVERQTAGRSTAVR